MCTPDMSYKYLDLQLTLTLDWRHQVAGVIKLLKDKGDRLARSFALPKQRLMVLQRCIIPAVTYSLPVAPYTRHDIERFDAMIINIAKRCLTISTSCPSAQVHEDKASCGWGLPSLLVDYTSLNIAHLTQSLNDHGHLGRVTRDLVTMQVDRHGNLAADNLMGHSKYCLGIKQLTTMKHCDLQLQVPQEVQDIHVNGNKLSNLLEDLRYDPLDLGQKIPVPLTLLQSLWQLGIISYEKLVEPRPSPKGASVLIDTHALKMRYGRIVKPKHILALHRLTLLICAHGQEIPNPLRHTPNGLLPRSQRVVRHCVSSELAAAQPPQNPSSALFHGPRALSEESANSTTRHHSRNCSEKAESTKGRLIEEASHK